MNVYIEEYRELLKVRYYTIRFENEELSETEQFFKRFHESGKPKHLADLGIIKKWILTIGKDRSAADLLLFRREKAAYALPPPFEVGNRLRLYCLVCAPDVIVLGGGGFKPKEDRLAQTSHDTAYPFEKINDVARILKSRIKQGRISLEPKALAGDYQKLFLS